MFVFSLMGIFSGASLGVVSSALDFFCKGGGYLRNGLVKKRMECPEVINTGILKTLVNIVNNYKYLKVSLSEIWDKSSINILLVFKLTFFLSLGRVPFPFAFCNKGVLHGGVVSPSR